MDSRAKNKAFAQSLGVTFPILSDEDKSVSRAYDVLMPILRWANRVTFVIDKQVIVREVIKGGAAIDPGGALAACSIHKP